MQSSKPFLVVEHASRIEQWQETACSAPKDEEQGLGASLVDTCEKSVQTLEDLMRLKPGLKRTGNRLRRCHAVLKLWADGHGVRDGSFDSILHRSSSIRHAILAILSPLCGTLLRGMRHFDIERTGNESTRSLLVAAAELFRQSRRLLAYAEQTDSGSESDLTDSDSDLEDSDLRHIVDNTKTYIDCLIDIGIALDQPALEPGSQEKTSLVATEQRSAQDYHTDLIFAKHPEADPHLAELLGQLSWSRYERLQLLRQRRAMLTSGSEMKDAEGKSHIAGTEFQDSGIGTSIPSSYAETTVSFMTSLTTGGNRMHIPPLPAEGRNGKPFECSVCCKNVRISDNRAWRKHLFNDLQPYTCVYTDCVFSTTTFKSRDLWSSHLELEHGFGPDWSGIECPLCRETTKSGKTQILIHFARHLEEISLSALPPDVESDAESDVDSASGSEHDVPKNADSEVTDSSDDDLSLAPAPNFRTAIQNSSEMEDEEVTRCVCGLAEYPGLPAEVRNNGGRSITTDDASFFIQCDTCKVWQHGGCVGIVSEDQTRDDYYCEQDRPDLHTVRTSVSGVKFSTYKPGLEEKFRRISGGPEGSGKFTDDQLGSGIASHYSGGSHSHTKDIDGGDTPRTKKPSSVDGEPESSISLPETHRGAESYRQYVNLQKKRVVLPPPIYRTGEKIQMEVSEDGRKMWKSFAIQDRHFDEHQRSWAYTLNDSQGQLYNGRKRYPEKRLVLDGLIS